jgi:hypothetical protein
MDEPTDTDRRISDIWKEQNDKFPASKETLFPRALSATPLTLSILQEQYAGIYFHPGYGELSFSPKEDAEGAYLHANVTRGFSVELILRHVNSRHWLGTRWHGVFPLKQAFRACSVEGADGKVEGFEIAMEPTMTDTMYFFKRAE